MTLGRLMELYAAEQQGKQIMLRDHAIGFPISSDRIIEVKLSECELSMFALKNDADECGYTYTLFIKDEEDIYGIKTTDMYKEDRDKYVKWYNDNLESLL